MTVQKNSRHLLDPEIAAHIDSLPAFDLSPDALAESRLQLNAWMKLVPSGYPEPEIRYAKGRDGSPDVPLHVYNGQPTGKPRPAVLHFHGGALSWVRQRWPS